MSVSYGLSNGGSVRRVKLPISEYLWLINNFFFIVLKTLLGVNSVGWPKN